MDLYNRLNNKTVSEPELKNEGARVTKPFNLKTTGSPFWDGIMNNPEYAKTSRGLEGEIAYMAPEEFIKKVAFYNRQPYDIEIDRLTPELYQRYAQMMKEGVKFDLPVIEYKKDNAGRVTIEHEGRHRAKAAMDLGLEQIPVFVIKPIGADIEEMMKESSIDFPQQELTDEVWVKGEDGRFHPKPEVEAKIMQTLKAYPELPLTELGKEKHIIGSIATNQYTEDSDIDVHIVLDPSDVPSTKTPEQWQKAVSKWYRDNRSHIGGFINDHPIEVYLQFNPTQEFMADGLYNWTEKKWVKGPLMRPMNFDPYSVYEPIINTVKEVVGETDQLIGELKRDVIDYSVIKKAMSRLPDEKKTELAKKLKTKLLKIETDVLTLMKQKKGWQEARRQSSSPVDQQQALQDIDYAKKWQDANVLFKFLNRYEYMKLIGELEKMMEKDKIEDAEVEKMKSLLGVIQK